MSSDRTEILESLRALNITKVTAHYSGSGDEGFIDEIDFEPGEPGQPMRRDLDDFFWDVLCNSQWSGFWDGEPGGYGQISWDVTTDKMKLQHTDYVRDTLEHPEEEVVFE